MTWTDQASPDLSEVKQGHPWVVFRQKTTKEYQSCDVQVGNSKTPHGLKIKPGSPD